MDAFDDDEFGGPLFGETSEQPVTSLDDRSTRSGSGDKLSFGRDDSGSLPHWTEPATGEVPRIEAVQPPEGTTDDLDVWSSFTTESPVWKGSDVPKDPTGEHPVDTTGELTWHDDVPAAARRLERHHDARHGDRAASRAGAHHDRHRSVGDAATSRPEAARWITTASAECRCHPAAVRRSQPAGGRRLRRRAGGGVHRPDACGGRPVRSPSSRSLLGLAAIEYFRKVTEKGYRPAVAAGVAACVAAPLAAYWVGDDGDCRS